MFGGTFNPVHNGHVRMVREIARYIGADKTVIVPTFVPVHKSVGSELADARDRLNMCALAFDMPNETVSDIEVAQDRPCYSYETLTKLKSEYPDCQLYMACGSDMFLTLHTWKEPQTIYRLATVCVVSRRENYSELYEYAEKEKKNGLRSVIIDVPPLDISSTQIRDGIKSGKDVSDKMPNRVYEYIREHGLYL